MLLVIAAILVVNIVLVALLSNKSVQNKLLSYGEDWLKEKTGTELSIGYVGFDLLNGLFVEELYVEDLSGDTLLYAGAVKAKVAYRSLLNLNNIRIKRVELDDFVVHIDRESDSTDFNFQFLVDAFASKDTTPKESSPIALKIKEIVLKNGYLTYDVNDAPVTPEAFNASHISCRDFQLEGAFQMDKKGNMQVELEELAFREGSGLVVTDLEAEASLIENHLLIPQLALSMPKSRLLLKGDCLLDKLQYEMTLRADSFSLSDLRAFVPMFSSMTDSMALSLSASGTFPAVWGRDLTIDYPSILQLRAPMVKLGDCTAWETTAYEVKVDELGVTPYGAHRILTMLGNEQTNLLKDYLPIHSQLAYKGTLPDGHLKMALSAPVGKVEADGDLHYQNSANYLGCDMTINCHEVALDSILQSPDFKKLNMRSRLKVAWRMDQMPDADLRAEVCDFSYRSYRYDTLNLAAHYFPHDSLSANLRIHDPNLGCDAWVGGADLTGEQPHLVTQAQLRHFSPSLTHLADSLGNLKVDVALSADVSDLNQFLGQVVIDSLRLTQDSTDIHWIHPTQVSHVTLSDGTRELTLSSPAVDATLRGDYEFADFYPAIVQVLRYYWPDLLDGIETSSLVAEDNFSFDVKVKEVDDWMRLLGQDMKLTDGATLKGNLSVANHTMRLGLDLPSLSMGKRMFRDMTLKLHANGERIKMTADVVADTSVSGASELMRGNLNAVVSQNRMEGNLRLNTFPDTTFVKGSLPFAISSKKSGTGRVNMTLTTREADWILMGYRFGITPAEIEQAEEKILVKNIGVTLDDNVLMSVDGTVSELLSDTLNIRFDQVSLEPIVSALVRKHIPLQCTLDGDLYACALLGEKMRFKTNNLRFDTIVYEGIPFGDLSVDMRWNNERKGVLSKMILTKNGKRVALVQGVVKPAEQRVKMVTSLDSLPLDIFTPFTSDYVTDTRGNIGANILLEGEFDNLALEGTLFFKDIHAKVNYTGVGYTISDTIRFEKNRMRLDHFTITDDHGKRLTLKGDVSHEKFKKFNYNFAVNMKDFMLLNNPKARKNTVYGLFYANAKNVTVQGSESMVKVRGEFSNGEKTSLNVVLPETVTEVQSYDNIVYVKKEEDIAADTLSEVSPELAMDIDGDITVKLTDEATFYVNVADGTMINGNGNLRVVYNEGNVSIYNRYTVNNGYVKIKLSEIPSKKFTIQEGAYVQFNGDPMKLNFDATACYDLTADLAVLSKSFSSMGLGSTRQPVRCSAHASGSLSEMNLTYDISLPKSADNVTQHMNSIITTDDIRIREFAYLIGLGMFYAPNEQAQGDEMLTSLASSSLSAALNNALSNVLKDKVTIGTGFSSSDEEFSDVSMNLSVSTKLLNDRLVLSTNLGYQKQSSGEEDENSFLGDFDAEYLLGKKKMLRIKAYNHTNNDYYRTSSNTQGVGVVFVKESKTLRGLLPFAKDENGKNLLAPRDTTQVKEERRMDDEKKK